MQVYKETYEIMLREITLLEDAGKEYAEWYVLQIEPTDDHKDLYTDVMKIIASADEIRAASYEYFFKCLEGVILEKPEMAGILLLYFEEEMRSTTDAISHFINSIKSAQPHNVASAAA